MSDGRWIFYAYVSVVLLMGGLAWLHNRETIPPLPEQPPAVTIYEVPLDDGTTCLCPCAEESNE